MSVLILRSQSGWQLTFEDDFNGAADDPPDPTKWTNPQLYNQCNGSDWLATSKAEDSYLDGSGNLVIRARSGVAGGCTVAGYTAGQLSTKDHFTQLYGAFEASIQLPEGGGGIWPAFWLDPLNGTWPPEVDIFEFVNDMTTHYTNYFWAGPNSALQNYTNSTLATGFHTYRLEWEPGELRWYVDGVLKRTATTNIPAMAMGVILDIYIGGSWTGPVTASFPQYMLVDYVRVYEWVG
jgi:beta-glucanase (GH16 family)